MASNPVSDSDVIDEQIDYYRAIAGEYGQHTIEADGMLELEAAFDSFDITGDVLELAQGTGNWTERIVATATTLTAVDSAPEMISQAKARLGDSPVEFIQADLFAWEPTRRYDSVFFGFFLSHVPDDRFEAFWSMIGKCVKPDGRIFFVDDNYRTGAELIEGPESSVIERRLIDGTPFRAIKVPHEANDLERRIRSLGWDISVSGVGSFYWGSSNL